MRTRAFRAGLALAIAMAAFGQAQADTLKLFVRAFIPDAVPGDPNYVKTIKDVNGKSVLVIKGPNPLENTCFATDQRSFSESDTASARITAAAAFAILSSTPTLVTDISDTGRTHALDCTTGAMICDEKASVDVVWSKPSDDGAYISFPFKASGANPCVVPQGLSPAIKLDGAFRLHKATGKLEISGAGSKFPALEAVAIYEGKAPVHLMKLDALEGVSNIPFSRTLMGETTLPIFNGTWKTNDPGGRFTLLIDGKQARWVEKAANGTTLERQVPLAPDKGGLFTAYRENDGAVLAFLGFSPDMIQEIQARGPKPSYVTIERNAGGISLTWAGLSATKDANNKFKDMKQPGEGPIKTFQMVRQ